MTDESSGNTATTAEHSGGKRPVGRPKGYPKTGGRPKGAKNRLPEEFRRFIDQRGRPLELLSAIARGNKVVAADPANPTEKIRIYPSLAERTTAARALLDRLLPSLKATEISGAGGGPVEYTGPRLEDEGAETVRRFMFLAERVRRADARDKRTQTVEGQAEPTAEPPAEPLPEPQPEPGPPPIPVGHEEQLGAHTLRLAERLADGRERWTASNGDGRTVAVGFSRDAVLAQIEGEAADG